jgi:alkanesulfonate monooxygenase SsuD/methylene tetrahydromethanopterin reductase-like flavin-dependent oxidoreductase (luciferase family)
MKAPARPLAIGLALGGPPEPRGWAALLETAEWADALGLHSVWLPEGHLRRGATASPLVALAAVAARTRRIRVGTTSLLISIRDPHRTAVEVATLDLLSGGRVVLGLGRGFEPAVFRAFDVDPRRKRDRFDRALDAMLAAWTGGSPPRPLQRPHPPLFVAAFGPKGLAQAGRRGLPYLASPLESLDDLARNFALHAAALPAGTPPGSLPAAVMRTVHVAADAAEARRVRADAESEYAALAARGGGALAARAEGEPAARVVVGEAGAVAEAIAGYRLRLGLDLLVVRPAPRTDAAARRASLARLVERVLPRLSDT